jgi:hypothetical protein
VGPVATIRERSKGVWEVRSFTGRDSQGRPTQVSRTVRAGKREAERVAAELTLRRGSAAGKVTVSELLDLWDGAEHTDLVAIDGGEPQEPVGPTEGRSHRQGPPGPAVGSGR